MKKFNTGVARIKNSEGKYEMLPALRGATSYEVAVRNGFKGTEDDWIALIIKGDWVGAYTQLDDMKANKIDVYTKGEADVRNYEILSQIAPIQPYLAFVGNVNPDMVAAAFGKGNEDDILGVGKALAMYANFKGETENVDYLVGYDKFSDIVENHKMELLSTPTVLELIKSSPYAYEVFAKTLTGLPDIVLYDAGKTEYLDISNATVDVDYVDANYQNDGVPYGSSVDTNDNISITKTAFTRGHDGFVEVFKYTIPLVKALPNLTLYRTLHVKLSDTEPSVVSGSRSRHRLNVTAANTTNTVFESTVLDDWGSGTSEYFTGEECTFDNSSLYESNPTFDNIAISIDMDAPYLNNAVAHYGTANVHIEKIWITEA